MYICEKVCDLLWSLLCLSTNLHEIIVNKEYTHRNHGKYLKVKHFHPFEGHSESQDARALSTKWPPQMHRKYRY